MTNNIPSPLLTSEPGSFAQNTIATRKPAVIRRVLTDHAKWANDWIAALENAKGVQWHRTTPKEKRIPAGKKLVAY